MTSLACIPMNDKFKYFLLLVIISSTILLQSCTVQNLFESSGQTRTPLDSSLFKHEYKYTLRSDDKISVSIWNHDDLSVGSIFGIYNSNEVYGKWVIISQEGFVELPQIGPIHIAGLNTVSAADKLKDLYSKYIVDPIIIVKVLNREVTVLGEVLDPGNHILEKEKNTLFEIIGKAGGMDFYADKKQVKLIRDNVEYDFDLTKMESFTLNNIILHNGDIIYVNSKKGKTLDKKAPTVLAFSSIATTIVVILSLFTKQ